MIPIVACITLWEAIPTRPKADPRGRIRNRSSEARGRTALIHSGGLLTVGGVEVSRPSHHQRRRMLE
jgi:hypothetical protein